MNFARLIIIYAAFFFLAKSSLAQVCNTDSNYYSTRFNTINDTYITNAILTSQNEIVTLCQDPQLKSSFVAKFTAQGNLLWSNKYTPDYPYVSWLTYPWYERSQLIGLAGSADSSYYVFGSSYEHGSTVNNVENPPTHLVGYLIKLDKFGKIIFSKYFGNWRTEYSVNAVTELANGNIVVYLRSHFSPFKSKVVCINKSGDIIWGVPLQPGLLYTEIDKLNPIMKQLKNGNLIVMNEMYRSIDDTLVYPFLIIILKAPLYLFSFSIIDTKSGNIINQTSNECPSLVNTNVQGEFIPRLISVTELPNGNISFCGDMYWPTDNNVVFYDHKQFSKRAVNLIINSYGFQSDIITYKPKNTSCSLESVWQKGNNGQQVLLVKDSTNKELIAFEIDQDGKVIGSRSYANPFNTESSSGFLMQKSNSNVNTIVQTDVNIKSFDMTVTNSNGQTGCSPLPARQIIAEPDVWPWPLNKVQYFNASIDIDFRYSSFNMILKSFPLSQNTYCKYQYACCTDIIDSSHITDASVCENETYILPDGTPVTAAGKYYVTLKAKGGCDSVVFYNLDVIKSPMHLEATPDTCMNGNSAIEVYATGGYDHYLWNNIDTSDSTFLVRFPGQYTVRVDNICGSKTDTLNVSDSCNFAIYFPNAFTPNGDLLNDILKFPQLNRNQLISLRIYNRYGQLVFQTSDASGGWDGTYKGVRQPPGIYPYILETKGIAGVMVNQKGSVTLIR